VVHYERLRHDVSSSKPRCVLPLMPMVTMPTLMMPMMLTMMPAVRMLFYLRVRYHTEDDGRRSKVESRHTQTIVGELGFFLDEPRYAVRSSSAVQTLMILRTGRSKRADACTRQRAHGMPWRVHC